MIPTHKAQRTAQHLKTQQHQTEGPFRHGTQQLQTQINEGHVGCDCIGRSGFQPHVFVSFTGKCAAVHLGSFGIITWQTMSWAWEKLEQLGYGPHKIDNLGNEKQQERLAKVSQNTHHGKGHAGKVAVGIADKNSGGVPVVLEETQGDADKRKHQHYRKQVIVGQMTGVDFHKIVK